MLNIPVEIINLLKADTTNKNIRVHFPNGEHPDITNENIFSESFVYHESICSQDKLKFGLCESPYVELETYGVGKIKGATIECSIEVQKTDGTYYSIPLGTFVVDSCKKQADMTHRKVIAYSLTDINWDKFPYVLETLKNGFYWNKNDLKLDLEALLKLSMISENEMSEAIYKSTPSAHEFETSVYNQSGERKILKFNFTSKASNLVGSSSSSNVASGIAFIYKYANGFDEEMNSINEYFMLNYSTKDILANALSQMYCPSAYYIHGFKSGTYTEKDYNDTIRIGNFSKFLPFSDITIVPCISLRTGNILDYENNILARYNNNDVFRVITSISVSQYNDETEEYDTLISTNEYDNKILMYHDEKLISENSSIFVTPKIESTSVKLYENYGTGTARTVSAYKYDFSNIFNTDLRKFIEAYCELKGKFGKTKRDGSFEMFSLGDKFSALYPSETLYPADDLYPQDNVGLDLKRSGYETIWYDDDEVLPFGSVSASYNNGTSDTYMKVYADGYSAQSDRNTYQNYNVSDNIIITDNTYTSTEMRAILNTIASNISGITYMPSEVTMQGRPDLEAGDVLSLKTTEGWITTLVLNRTLNGIQKLTDSITSD